MKIPWKEHLEIAASYLAGEDPKTGLQYHIQITAIHSPHPEDGDAEDAARLCPDYAAAATEEQLSGSQGHVVLGRLSLRIIIKLFTVILIGTLCSMRNTWRVGREEHRLMDETRSLKPGCDHKR